MSIKEPERPQLHMIWPVDRPEKVVQPGIAPGYKIRIYQSGDEDSFLSLMVKTDFDPWDDEKLRYNVSKIIPNGWFFVEEERSQELVGSAMCLHNYSGKRPFTGDVGWLAVDPAHRSRGLGYSLIVYVTNRFLHAGYSQIQLHTEYYRLPAIRIYLKMGYLPVIPSAEIEALWEEVCEKIGWEFTPEKWLKTERRTL